jgi:hypothetical protein
MSKKIIIVFTIILVFLVLAIVASFLWYRSLKPLGIQEDSFLTLTEYPISNANYFYGPTLDGKEILFSKRKGTLPDTRCEIYSKSLETNQTNLVAKLDFHCPQKLVLSKDGDFLFFEISNAIIEKIPEEAYDYYNIVDRYKKSIYAYNLKEKKSILLKKGLEKEDYTSSGGGITGINYLLIGPSPSENNKVLILEENEYLISKSIGGGPHYNYGYFNNTLLVYDTKTNQEITIFREYEWSPYCFVNCTDDPISKYQYPLTRWSPKGDAVIFEKGLLGSLAEKLDVFQRGGVDVFGKDTPQNTQYVVYLDNLEQKELKSENFQEDINSCGYYYNGNLNSYQQLSEPVEYVYFLPDGKTYIRKYAVPSLGTPTEYYYVLKVSRNPYCSLL